MWIRWIRIRNTGLQPMKLVEEVHEGGVESLGVHVGDGGHLEVDVEVKLAGEAGIG